MFASCRRVKLCTALSGCKEGAHVDAPSPMGAILTGGCGLVENDLENSELAFSWARPGDDLGIERVSIGERARGVGEVADERAVHDDDDPVCVRVSWMRPCLANASSAAGPGELGNCESRSGDSEAEDQSVIRCASWWLGGRR